MHITVLHCSSALLQLISLAFGEVTYLLEMAEAKLEDLLLFVVLSQGQPVNTTPLAHPTAATAAAAAAAAAAE